MSSPVISILLPCKVFPSRWSSVESPLPRLTQAQPERQVSLTYRCLPSVAVRQLSLPCHFGPGELVLTDE